MKPLMPQSLRVEPVIHWRIAGLPLGLHHCTCYDQDYNSSTAGSSFKDCVTCELGSVTFDHQTNQTDVGWALYNLRYATSWCLFDYPRSQYQEIPTPCNQTCGSIATALETNLLTPNKSQPYDYCEDPNFSFGAAACALCYARVPNQQLMSNFLNTLQSACQSQPAPTGYLPIDSAQVFTLTPSISPLPTQSSDSSTPPTSSSDKHNGFSWDAKVAIAISVPVAVLLIFSLLCLLFYVHRHNRHRRHRKKHLTKSASHRSRRPGTVKPNQAHKTHRKTLSDDTTSSEKRRREPVTYTFNRPYTYPYPNSIHEDTTIPYPAPLRTRTTTTPSPGLSKYTQSPHPSNPLSPPLRSRLPSNVTATRPPTASPTQTANSLSPAPLKFSPRTEYNPHPAVPPPLSPIHSLHSPQQTHHSHSHSHTNSSNRHSLSPSTQPPLNFNPSNPSAPTRPPPPAPGLLQWEQRGIQHARSKSLRDSLRRSGESRSQTPVGERVKVAMQVPKGANISEWKGETRSVTPVTEESGVGTEEEFRVGREKGEKKEGREGGGGGGVL
ncbi:MAG: hypothetical protein L6R37_001884 [Teloschistes peruensis]|nr:MAG: hypothetical protein L6R37_001884 [Teloschistes peruensis]